MPVSKTEPEQQISQSQYLLARMFAGCTALQEEGSWADADETYSEAIDFGERQIFTHHQDAFGNWQSLAQRAQMPVVVISTNQHQGNQAGGDCAFDSSGITAAHVYLAQDTNPLSIWHGPNFYSSLFAQLWAQKAGLTSPGAWFPDLTLPIKQIEIIGPTRTPQNERGKNLENDYWDAVFMIHWSDD